jgi:prepilin-type N-terminal cleavage/methylation domain-containing protein
MKKPPQSYARLCPRSGKRLAGFTLVELLAVITIITILMTMGLVGIKNLTNGKGTVAVVSSAEALFEEARLVASSKATTARVLVDVDPDHDVCLRRILVAYNPLKTDGTPDTTKWELSSRGYIMPEGVYFSKKYSKAKVEGGEFEPTSMTFQQTNYSGKYIYFEFNSEGICTTPGASFIVGAGARAKSGSTYKDPVVSGNAKRDFGGFVLWRNGRTSLFRHPDQMDLPSNVKEF